MSQENNPKKKLNRDGVNKLLSIYSYIIPYKWTFGIGLIFLVLSSLTALAFPYIIGIFFDISLQGNDAGFKHLPIDLNNVSINQVALFLVVILIFQGIFSFLRVLTFSRVSEFAMADIRASLFGKLLSLPYPFYEENRVGELTSRITSDITQLQEALSWTLAEFFRQIATLIVGVIVIALLSPQLGLLMLATFPALVIMAAVFGRYIKSLSKKTQQSLADANVVAEESLQNIQVIKSFTNEKFEHKRYETKIQDVVTYALKVATLRGLFISFFIISIFGGIILVLWRGMTMVQTGQMTPGELISFIMFTIYIGASLGGFGNIYSRILKAIGASERVLEIIATDSETDLDFDASKEKKINGEIEFKNVEFAYPTRKDKIVLDRMSLSIKQGQKIALVGASGAGKSTIVQLLLRIYDIDQGEILIDGKNVNEMNISGLRSQIGMVPQEVMLFGGSIRDNIAYGKIKATDEEIINAAKQANAWEFIDSFPENIQTMVGERGVQLSGGQRQRIAIARAILKDPAILVLDEATSALDSESEQYVQDALNNLMINRTSIVIAHRLSTIREVDIIFVIEDGKISEFGNHETLLQNPDSKYKFLLELQTEQILHG